METKEYKSRDIVGAIFLIFVGIIFLLNTTDIVGWSIWLHIFKFWPIFLILGGFKLILGKSLTAEAVIFVIALLLFISVGILSFIFVSNESLPVDMYREEKRAVYDSDEDMFDKRYTVFKEEYVESIKKKYVKLNISGAKFDLSDDSISEYLNVSAHYPKTYKEPRLEEEIIENDVLNINFDSAIPSSNVFYRNIIKYDFVLGRTDVPTDIDITLGAGNGVVSLDDGVYTKIRSTTGAGKLTMRIGGRGVPSDGVDIKVGAGESILELPEDVGYLLEYDLGIGTIISSDGEIISSVADSQVYKSKNYDSSEKKIKISASVGVGSLVINKY